MGPVGMEKKGERKMKERFYVVFYKSRDVSQSQAKARFYSKVEVNKKKLNLGRPDLFRIAHWAFLK